jgi:hypothetical protein
MANVIVHRGSEGPTHDPYSYVEVTFHPTNKSAQPVIIHMGLAVWVKVGRQKVVEHNDKECYEMFVILTGLTPEYAESIPEKRRARYLRKLSRKEREQVYEIEEIDLAMLRNAY